MTFRQRKSKAFSIGTRAWYSGEGTLLEGTEVLSSWGGKESSRGFGGGLGLLGFAKSTEIFERDIVTNCRKIRSI